MRLIHCKTLHLKEFSDAHVPRYAILSHRWNAPEEVTLQDMLSSAATGKAEYYKVTGTCQLALSHGIEYVWIDSCCMDKTNDIEVRESIISMFRWYQNAAVCYVYLYDLKSSDADAFQDCVWFTRGWTLQELLAPRNVEFYDSKWKSIGSKVQLSTRLSKITLIPEPAILGHEPLAHYSFAQRMSWASRRITTRIEDSAYCLFGILEAYVVPVYGEREKAFQRLQEEIIKHNVDLTAFAWLPTASRRDTTSVQMPLAHHGDLTAYMPLFALTTAEFEMSYPISRFSHTGSDFSITNRGLRITTSLVLLPFSEKDVPEFSSRNSTMCCNDEGAERYRYVLPLGISESTDSYVGIWLKKIGPDSYLRENMSSLAMIPENKIRAVRTTESQTCYVLLSPSAVLSAAAGTPRSIPSMAMHAGGSLSSLDDTSPISGNKVSTSAIDNLHIVYHPRLYPEGIYVPDFGAYGIQYRNLPPRLWDERTRICCQPESLNDVVAFSCTSQQGPSGYDKVSFGILLDFRDKSQGPQCVIIDMSSPETRGIFVLLMRHNAQPARWNMVENELPAVTGCGNVLKMTSETGHEYVVAASISGGNAQIDGQAVPMATLGIKITTPVSDSRSLPLSGRLLAVPSVRSASLFGVLAFLAVRLYFDPGYMEKIWQILSVS